MAGGMSQSSSPCLVSTFGVNAHYETSNKQCFRAGAAKKLSQPVAMRLLLDCEWADPIARQLVSLALIDSTGQHRFYAELVPLLDDPTDFARDVVYPVLDRGDTARHHIEFTRDLRIFLAWLDYPRLVLSDHLANFVLLEHALAGLGIHIPGDVPAWKPIEITMGDVLMRCDLYFYCNEDVRRRRHHAMVDAEALRWAFENLIQERS